MFVRLAGRDCSVTRPANCKPWSTQNPMRFTSSRREPEDFAEICRLATAKHLAGPDQYLTSRAVEQIKNGEVEPQSATEVLCRRLRQVCAQGRREQKIILALSLIEQILAQCRSRLNSHQESALMQEIGRVAILPMDRFAPSLKTAQDSKALALKIISQHQQGPQSPHSHNGRSSEGMGSSPQRPVQPKLTSQEAIQTCILRANAQIELVQEAVLPMSTDDAHAVSDSDRKFLDASVGALQSYKNDLEAAINFLAGHETDASASLMADCLKTTDALNTTMTLYREVMEAKQQQGSSSAPSSARSEQPTAPLASVGPLHAPPPHAAPPPRQAQADLLGFDSHEMPAQPAHASQASTARAPQNEAMLREMGWL